MSHANRKRTLAFSLIGLLVLIGIQVWYVRAMMRQAELDRALIRAVETNDADAVRRLVAEGADPNGQPGYENSAYTHFVERLNRVFHPDVMPSPVMTASRSGHLKIALFLLDASADPDRRDSSGWTPLMYACLLLQRQQVPSKEWVAFVKRLIARGADVNAQDHYGITALMLSVNGGGTPDRLIVPKLLLDAGASINVRDSDGETALYWACKNQSIRMVRLLLAHRANVNIRTRQGKTALSVARHYKNSSLIRLLEQVGAKE